MSALIVPLHLMRNAVAQSARFGADETRDAVIARVLNDLRTTDHHPAVAAVLALHAHTAADAPNRSAHA